MTSTVSNARPDGASALQKQLASNTRPLQDGLQRHEHPDSNRLIRDCEQRMEMVASHVWRTDDQWRQRIEMLTAQRDAQEELIKDLRKQLKESQAAGTTTQEERDRFLDAEIDLEETTTRLRHLDDLCQKLEAKEDALKEATQAMKEYRDHWKHEYIEATQTISILHEDAEHKESRFAATQARLRDLEIDYEEMEQHLRAKDQQFCDARKQLALWQAQSGELENLESLYANSFTEVVSQLDEFDEPPERFKSKLTGVRKVREAPTTGAKAITATISRHVHRPGGLATHRKRSTNRTPLKDVANDLAKDNRIHSTLADRTIRTANIPGPTSAVLGTQNKENGPVSPHSAPSRHRLVFSPKTPLRSYVTSGRSHLRHSAFVESHSFSLDDIDLEFGSDLTLPQTPIGAAVDVQEDGDWDL